MSLEAAKKIVEKLNSVIIDEQLGKPHFSDKRVKTFPLISEGFKFIRGTKSKRKLFFVDGGNQEIIGAPNFSLQLNRIYFGIWAGKNRINEKKITKKVEFFSATYADYIDDEIHYSTFIIPSNQKYKNLMPLEKDLSFNSFDRTLMNGGRRADIGRAASIARRFAEWHFSSKIVETEMVSDDVLVVDGTLQTTFTNEEKYLKKLFKEAKKNSVVVTGLSKTSTLFTTMSLSLLGSINKLAEDYNISGKWYFPIAESFNEDHEVVLLFLKLNEISDRIFRFEVQREKFNSMKEIHLDEMMTLLSDNASDATFPGYPYGLIDADRFARVSYDEIEYYRGMILSQINELGKWKKFSRHINASDAHSILNILVG
jgi:hypothetical protein